MKRKEKTISLFRKKTRLHAAGGMKVLDVSHVTEVSEVEIITPPASIPLQTITPYTTDPEEEQRSKKATIEAQRRIREAKESGEVDRTIVSSSSGTARFKKSSRRVHESFLKLQHPEDPHLI